MDPRRPLDLRPRELRDALDAGDISVALQPIVNLRSGEVVRFEALARWWHPTRGLIPPTTFIPLAEESERITPLTFAVLLQTGRHLSAWRGKRSDLLVDVNVSMITLQDPSFPRQLSEFCSAYGWSPSWFGFEITESSFMHDPESTAHAVDAIRALGCRVSIDDFGTGYSSLSHLASLAVTAMKIDRQFVTPMAANHRREAIVRASIALGHDLGFEVVAEGVEDRETWDLLRAHGCDLAQGYHIARPMPAETVTGWLAEWTAGLDFIRPQDTGHRPLGSADATRPTLPDKPVLIVDDEPAILAMICDILEQYGFRVVTAANGAEALQILDAERPRLVILDMNMPVLDGAGFVDAMRQRKIEVPLVVMTAGSSAERWARELDADAYLTKPFELANLLEVTGRLAAPN